MKFFSRTLIASMVFALMGAAPSVAISQAGAASMRSGTGTAPASDVEATELKLFKVSQALLQDPQNPELLLQKGSYLSSLERLQAAFDVFDALRQAYPHHPAPYANLASVYARWGRFEEARQMLLKSDLAQGNRVQTQLNLAAVNLELALAALNKASQLNPGDRSTQQKVKALEKYLADTDSASFATSGNPSRQATTEAGLQRAAKDKSNPTAGSKAGASMVSPPVNARDRLTLAAPDLGDVARPPPSVTQADSKVMAIPLTTDARKQEILKSVMAWANAWTSRSYSDYMTFYGTNFRPAGDLSRDVWAQHKKVTMEKASRIHVDLKISRVTFTETTATVILSQKYRSDRYADSGRKELLWVREEGHWKIAEEKTIR